MNLHKMIGWACIAVAIVSAFVALPSAALILTLLGIVSAFGIAAEDSLRLMVSALVLAGCTGVLKNIPGAGDALASIFGSLGTIAAAASVTAIGRNVWNRYKP